MSIFSKKSFLSSHSPLKYLQNDSWLRPFEAIELILRKNRIKKFSKKKKKTKLHIFIIITILKKKLFYLCY